MYQVQYRLPGGAWHAPLLPTSLQVAAGLAQTVKHQRQLEDVRIESPHGEKPNRLVDILV